MAENKVQIVIEAKDAASAAFRSLEKSIEDMTRWAGSGYGVLNPSLALGETESTAYRGDRGKAAYDHSQIAHDYAPSSHVGTGGDAHAVATESVAGFMAAASLAKLNGIETGATADMTAAEILAAIGYKEGTFTATGGSTEFSDSPAPSATWSYVRSGKMVTIQCEAISGTSTATSFTITGLPVELRPSAAARVPVRVKDNGGALQWGIFSIATGGSITVRKDANMSTFTASGTKGVDSTAISYIL